MKRIPFLRPNLVKREQYSNYLFQIDETRLYSNYGPLNTLFERRVIDEYFDGQGAATTVNNATTGLILAISLLKRRRGKYAVMPSFTFPAAPLAAMWCGLEPYFVDIRHNDWCADEDLLADVVKRLDDQVAVIVPYAAFGTNMDLSFFSLLHDSGVPVVVDAAASFGATSSAGHFGKNFPGAVVFSFHATKAFGIGEGGMVYSQGSDLISRVRQAGNFGLSGIKECMFQGLNGKLSEYAAAIALATLDVYAIKMDARNNIYGSYLEHLKEAKLLDQGWVVQWVGGKVPFQFMTVLCPEGYWNGEFVSKLLAKGIDSRTYFSPACHQQSCFALAPRNEMTVTEGVSKRVLSLPLWEEMTQDEVNRIVQGLL